MADLDITVLIHDEHQAFRRSFAEIEQLPDREQVARRWRQLADALEVHAVAEEQILYPELLQEVDDSERDTEHAVKDHNEIRQATRAVDAHDAGTDSWWEAFRAAREATVEHLGEEEADVLPPFRAEISTEARTELGRAWLAFRDRHEHARGLTGEEPDPQAYVEAHS